VTIEISTETQEIVVENMNLFGMTLHLPRWISALWAFSKSKIVHMGLFLVVNVVIGSLGVWMPIMASVARPDMFAREELIKVLQAGGPYTFAVAYLAGSTSFLAYEYLDGNITSNRRWKTSLGVLAFVLIILCTLLSAIQTPPERNIPRLETSITVSSDQASPVTSDSSSSLAERNHQKQSNPSYRELNLSELVQLRITILAILVGLGLFFVSRLGDEDLKEQFERIYRRETKDSEGLAARAASATDDGVKV
jgi:hypothetical protein